MQQVALGLTLGTGLYKNRNSWTGLDHWQIQLELSQFAGNPNLNEQLGTEYPLQSLVTPTGMWITQASLERIEGNKKINSTGTGANGFTATSTELNAATNAMNTSQFKEAGFQEVKAHPVTHGIATIYEACKTPLEETAS